MIVVLDIVVLHFLNLSGFYVSKGTIEMHEKLGVCGQALIKKRGANWPKGVPDNEINCNFSDMPLGYCETLWLEIEEKQMFIHCMKEEKYVTKFMSTFGMIDEVPTYKPQNQTYHGGGDCGVLLPQASVTAQQSETLGGQSQSEKACSHLYC